MVDTLVLGTSAQAWGFKSLHAHHLKRGCKTSFLLSLIYSDIFFLNIQYAINDFLADKNKTNFVTIFNHLL